MQPPELELRACPGCGDSETSGSILPGEFDFSRLDSMSFSSRKDPDLMHFRLVECVSCKLLYASPAPSDAWLAGVYRRAGFASSREAQCAARTYRRELERFRERFIDLERALDVGAGEGSLLNELVGFGFGEVTGVEPSEAPIQTASPEIRSRIRHEMFSASNFQPESFSLITCCQTLEHLRSPKVFCEQAWGLLKPGGALCIVVHNRRSPVNRIFGKHSPIFDVEHLQLFCPMSVTEMLGRSGFSRVSADSFSNSYPIDYWLRLLPFGSAKSLAYTLPSWLKFGVSLPVGNLFVLGWK